ncbi:MAG: hypothetical protein QXP36_14920 [Conexivisphaerales archaeon]
MTIGNWTSEEYRNKFLMRMSEEKLEEKIELFENVSESEKNQILPRSKFFIRFGTGEFGTLYGTLEALENGVPVIVDKELGIADDLRGYSDSLIVEDVSNEGVIEAFIKTNDI